MAFNESRRTFLKAFAASIVAAAAPDALANIASVAQVIDPHFKYKEALRLYDQVLTVRHDSELASKEMDVVLRFVRENFAAPEKSEHEYQVCYNILHNTLELDGHLYEEVRKVPPTILESVWIVALLKSALTHDHLPLDPQAMEEFQWFHEVYSDMVLKSHGIRSRNFG